MHALLVRADGQSLSAAPISPEMFPAAVAEPMALLTPAPPAVARYAAGRSLYLAGDPAVYIFEIVEGSVLLSQQLPEGRRQILDIAGAGRFLGLGSAERYDCNAQAHTDCAVRAHRREALEAGVWPPAGALGAMAGELRRLRRLLSVNGRKYALERVAAFLETLAEADATPAVLAMPLNRSELADYVGLTLETASRCFTRLKRLGIIGSEAADFIEILDWPRLRKIALGADAEA